MKKENGLNVIFSIKSKKNGKVYTGFKTGETTNIGMFVFDSIVCAQTDKVIKTGTKVTLPKGVKIDKGWIRQA